MTEQRPEIGANVLVNGITTNHLEAGEGEPVVLIHGSGPGVSAYANWRLTIPTLATGLRVLAPDMVGFGFTQRPDSIDYTLKTWSDRSSGSWMRSESNARALWGTASAAPSPCRSQANTPNG